MIRLKISGIPDDYDNTPCEVLEGKKELSCSGYIRADFTINPLDRDFKIGDIVEFETFTGYTILPNKARLVKEDQ